MNKQDYKQLMKRKELLEKDYPFLKQKEVYLSNLSKEEKDILSEYKYICSEIEAERKNRYESDYDATEDIEETLMEDSVGFLQKILSHIFHRNDAHKKTPIYCDNVEIKEQEFDVQSFVKVYTEPEMNKEGVRDV